MKNYLIVFILVLSQFAIAQKKELTLSDAVLGRFFKFNPESVSNLQWTPKSTLSWTSKDGKSLMVGAVKEEGEVVLTLEALNEALEQPLRSFPRITWLDDHRFYFRSRSSYIQYDLSSKSAKKMLELPENAANGDFNAKNSHLAYTVDNNLFVKNPKGKLSAVTNFDDPNIVCGQSFARNEFGISKGTFWSPEGNFLAFYQKDETDVADYPLLDIMTTPGQLRTTKYPMAGQKSEYPEVGIYSLKNNKTVYLEVDGPKDQYLTNLGWGPNEKYVYVAVLNRDQNHMWLNKYDASTGKLVKTLFEEKHPKYVEPEHACWFIPGRPNEFLWFSERDGFNHLYHYNTNGRLLGQVTKGEWLVLSILGLDNTGDKVLVQGTDESGLNVYAYEAAIYKDKIKRLTKVEGTHRLDLSSDGKHLIDIYSSIDVPRVTDIINLKGKVVKNLLTAEDPLADYSISKPELLTLKAKDGTPLHARVIKPTHFDANKKYPVLVYVYGGPHAQMLSNRYVAGAALWMYHMAERGYIVFTLDNRGSANRGFEFENIIHRQLGDVEMEDQLTGVKYLKSLPYVDADRMAVHGWSYGGFMTTSLMLRQPGVFKVGVAGGPVTDWKYYEAMYGERYMDRPEENPEGYKKSSVLNYVGNLEGDLLLIHGTVDPTVVMQHNLMLVKKFVDAGKQVDFFPYPMYEHNVRGKDRVHLMTKVLGYVEDKLGE